MKGWGGAALRAKGAQQTETAPPVPVHLHEPIEAPHASQAGAGQSGEHEKLAHLANGVGETQ